MLGSLFVAAFETAIALTRQNRRALEQWEEELLEARDARADLPMSVSELRDIIIKGEPSR